MSGSNKIQKSKHACIVEAYEYKFVHKVAVTQVYICASGNEDTGCQSRCRQGVGQARNFVVMANDQSQEQKKRSSKRHRKKGGQFILLHERTCAISKTRSWNRYSQNIKDVLYSGVALRRTTLTHTLHSPSAVRQHHKRRPQKATYS